MQSDGLSVSSVAGSLGMTRERSGRPYPHVWREKASFARDKVRPTRTNRTPHGPGSSLNVKGALPLLLIGGFAVASSIVLALQSATLPGHRLPIWVLVSVAGATILGAGVFSLFWAEVEEGEGAPERQPRSADAIEGEVLTRRGGGIPLPRPSAEPTPPWWEGPPIEPLSAPVRPRRPAVPREEPRWTAVRATAPVAAPRPTRPASGQPEPGAVRTKAPPRTLVRSAPTIGPATSALRGGFPKEFMDSLAELEDLADRELKLSSRHPPRAGVGDSGSCADCKREMSVERSPNRCSHCKRKLCVECALSSQLEDGELRCIECRVRKS